MTVSITQTEWNKEAEALLADASSACGGGYNVSFVKKEVINDKYPARLFIVKNDDQKLGYLVAWCDFIGNTRKDLVIQVAHAFSRTVTMPILLTPAFKNLAKINKADFVRVHTLYKNKGFIRAFKKAGWSEGEIVLEVAV